VIKYNENNRRWIGTVADNMHDRDKKGRTKYPPKYKGKLSDVDVLEIRKLSKEISKKELAKKFNCSYMNIYYIITNRSRV
jgi:hypothetical protein